VQTLPPTGRHDDTDGDSGDDNVSDGDPNNLHYHQLIAEVAVRLRKPDGDIVLGLDDDFKIERQQSINQLGAKET